MEILLLVLGLLLFVCLVIVHEFGHFIMARRSGVDVEEFGIGFPPKVATFYIDKKGTKYTINALPLGGFVRLKGENDAAHEHGTFGAATFSGKVKIMVAGVVMNLVTAWIMLTLLAVAGIPQLPLPSGEKQFTIASDTKVVSNKVFVGYVEKDGPADKAGIKSGDEIIAIREADIKGQTGQKSCNICPGVNPNPGACSPPRGGEQACWVSGIESASSVRSSVEDLLQKKSEQITVSLAVKNHKDVTSSIIVTPRSLQEVADSAKTDNPKGYLGIQPYDYTVQRSTWSAPVVGVGLIGQYTKLTLTSLGSSISSLFQGKGKEASANVSGPVGIFVALRDGASFGLSYILLVIALLSLTLAIMNVLPIPALDGGKLFLIVLFKALNKPLSKELEEKIHGLGFLGLMALFVLITIVDVGRFF